MMHLPPNDPYIEAIVERVRMVVRQPGCDLQTIANSLHVPPDDFCRLILARGETINVTLLIDVLGALVRIMALDPKWLLTGEYDGRVHRRMLELVEANPRVAESTVREWVREQYRRLREGDQPWSSLAE